MKTDESTRRRFLRLSGVVGSLGVTGCSGFIGGGNDLKDTDGDGVIDSEDYAPRDASVQRAAQVRETNTAPTETQTTTETDTETQPDRETATTTPEPDEVYRFEPVVPPGWQGEVSVNDPAYLVRIEHDGSTYGDSAQFGQALREEPLGDLPQRLTFQADFTRNSLENNVVFGIAGDPEYHTFDYSDRGHIAIMNTERREEGDRFVLFVTEGNRQDPTISGSFLVNDPQPTFELIYDGREARVFFDGVEVASLPVSLRTPLYGGVSLEDDPDTTAGDRLTLLEYSEQSI